MDKYVMLFCKQNPKVKIRCNNPDCKCKATVSSENVFREDFYVFTCPDCGKETICNTSKFTDDFKNQLEKIGVSIK